MASDIEMEDAPDKSGASDAESLASTAESEQASEYAVEDILAEREFYVEADSDESDEEAGYVTQYLVKWLGYPIDRCSWEPKEQFDTEETLRNWETKKQMIADGRKKAFSIKQWEHHCAVVAEKTEQRKAERRRKRERRARQKSNQAPQDADSGVVHTDQPEASSSVPHRAPKRLSMDSVTSSTLFLPAETPPPTEEEATPRQSSPRQGPETSTMSTTQTTSYESPRSRLAQLAKDISAKHKPPAPEPPVQPKSPERARTETARPALSEFGVGPGSKRACRAKSKWNDRAPGISEVTKPMKPGEFAPRTMMKDNTPAMALATKSFQAGETQNQIANETPTRMVSPPKPPFSLTGEQSVPPSGLSMAPPEQRSPASTTSAFSSAPSQPHPWTAVNKPARPAGPPGQIPSPVVPSGPRAKAGSINKPAIPPGPPGPISSPVVPSGPGAEATSKSAEPSSSNTIAPSHIPTQPRAFANAENSARVRDLQDSRDRRDSSRPSAGTYRPSEISRPSSPSRRSPPRRRSPHSRQLSPARWSSPPRRSPSRRSSPSRQSSPSQLSSPSRWSPPRRKSPSRRPSPRRSSQYSFPSTTATTGPRTGASVQPELSVEARMARVSVRGPRSPSPDYSRPIASESSAEALAKIARMPVREIPNIPRGLGGVMLAGDYWWDNSQEEALIHVYFGPEKRYVGPLRLCGIHWPVKRDLILSGKTRGSNRLDVWFRYLCTAAEFERLHTPSPDNIGSTGWVEGFEDTNAQLFQMAEDLRKDDLIAIFYPLNQSPKIKYAWVAWSHGSPSFNFPPRSSKDIPSDVEIPLLVAAHTMLRPIDTLGPRIPQPLDTKPQVPSPDTSMLNRIGLPGTGSDQGYDRLSKRPSFHNDTTMSASLQPQDPWSPAPAQDSLVTTEDNHYSPAELVPQFELSTSDNPAMNAGAKAVFDAYMNEQSINVEELARIEVGGKVSKAHLFYLHFPSDDTDVQDELEALKQHLKFHGMTVLTNLDPDGWAKFEQSSKMGVVIFHESFNRYEGLQPPLSRVVLNKSLSFWVIRLRSSLELMDDRYCSPKDHCARIFPNRGVVMLTEDMLNDLKGTAITIQWLRSKHPSKTSTPWQLMLHPRILEWIERRLNDEHYSKDHGLLGLVKSLIIKCNVSDLRTELFKESSLDPDSSNPVISHPVYGYGTRTEHDEPKIKDKVERDADHLTEFFAGWSLLNRQRFRYFVAATSFKLPAGKRWTSWGHIDVVHGGYAVLFKCLKVNTDEIWAYLSHSSSKSRKSQPSTPVAATTPRTPDYAAHSAKTSVQSTFQQGNPDAQGHHRYPDRYK